MSDAEHLAWVIGQFAEQARRGTHDRFAIKRPNTAPASDPAVICFTAPEIARLDENDVSTWDELAMFDRARRHAAEKARATGHPVGCECMGCATDGLELA